MMRSFEHEIHVALPPADALLLFTPRGEEAWIDDWRPEYLEPPDGSIRKDMIFRTGEGDESTTWTCLDWDPGSGRVRYHRLTPASRLAFVEVRCAPAADGTRVTVQYQYVPLTDAGASEVATIDPDEFARMIDGWADLIAAHLARRPAPPSNPTATPPAR